MRIVGFQRLFGIRDQFVVCIEDRVHVKVLYSFGQLFEHTGQCGPCVVQGGKHRAAHTSVDCAVTKRGTRFPVQFVVRTTETVEVARQLLYTLLA